MSKKNQKTNSMNFFFNNKTTRSYLKEQNCGIAYATV